MVRLASADAGAATDIAREQGLQKGLRLAMSKLEELKKAKDEED